MSLGFHLAAGRQRHDAMIRHALRERLHRLSQAQRACERLDDSMSSTQSCSVRDVLSFTGVPNSVVCKEG